jgi:hypothetical protein
MMLHKKRLSKGCFDTKTKQYIIGNIVFKTCLGNYQNSIVNHYWMLYTHYQNNLLPYNGSYGDQPAKVIEVFNIIQGLIREYEQQLEKMKKQTDKLNKKFKNG